GEDESERFVQTVIVIVEGEEARHVVVVYEGDEVGLPSEVTALGRDDRVDVAEVCVRAEDVADGRVEREVEERDAALVGELVGVVIERVGRVALIPLAEQEAIAVGVDRVRQTVLPTPSDVLDGVDAEAVHAMLLELLRGGL